ncbi:MAG: single-stranded DNA-binding protein [Lachnospiraceae bacterium]|nr:single-stranded DNA-binding protein [Lachnospiraceae bacterium]
MNKVILVGRLTRDPEVRYSAGDNAMAIARYSLAVDRRGRRDNSGGDQPTADFINIVAFGRDGEFAEKYLRKGTRILVEGRIQTGSYTNKEGQKVYTTDVVVERHEFVDSKSSSQSSSGTDSFIPASAGGDTSPADSGDGFMNIPDGIDEELPFS